MPATRSGFWNAAHTHRNIIPADLLYLVMHGCADADVSLRCSNEYWPSEVSWILWDGKSLYGADERTDELLRFREGAVLSVAHVWRDRHRLPIAGADPWQCIRPSEWLAIVREPSPSAMIDALDAGLNSYATLIAVRRHVRGLGQGCAGLVAHAGRALRGERGRQR